MRARNLSRAAALVLAMLLAACGSSAPTVFYTLKPNGSVGPSSVISLPLRIARVEVPGVLDRPEIVREMGGNQLKVEDLSHWAAPLGQLMRATLVENLIRRLPGGQVVPTDAPRPASAIDVSVEIVAVHETAGSLSVDATWTRTRPAAGDGGATTVRTERFSISMRDTSNSAYAEALSTAIGQLADAIAGQIGGR